MWLSFKLFIYAQVVSSNKTLSDFGFLIDKLWVVASEYQGLLEIAASVEWGTGNVWMGNIVE